MSKSPKKPQERKTYSYASRETNRKMAWLLHFFVYQIDCLDRLKDHIENTVLEKKDLPASLRDSWVEKTVRITEVRNIYGMIIANLNRSGKPKLQVKGNGDVLYPFDPLKHKWTQIVINDPSDLSIVANIQEIKDLEALFLFLDSKCKQEDPSYSFIDKINGRQFLCSFTNQEGMAFQQNIADSLGEDVEHFDEILNPESGKQDRLTLLETCFPRMKSINHLSFVIKTVYGSFLMLVLSSSDFKMMVSSEAGKAFAGIIEPLNIHVLLFPYTLFGDEKREPIFITQSIIDIRVFAILWANMDYFALLMIDLNEDKERVSPSDSPMDVNILVMKDNCSHQSDRGQIGDETIGIYDVKWVPLSKYLFENNQKNAEGNLYPFHLCYGFIDAKLDTKSEDFWDKANSSRSYLHGKMIPWAEYGDDRYYISHFLTVGETRRSFYRVGPSLARARLKGLELDPEKRRAELTSFELESLFYMLKYIHEYHQTLYALRWRELIDIYRIVVRGEDVAMEGLFVEHIRYYHSIYELYLAVKEKYKMQLISLDVDYAPIEQDDEEEKHMLLDVEEDLMEPKREDDNTSRPYLKKEIPERSRQYERTWPVGHFRQGHKILIKMEEYDRMNIVRKANYTNHGNLFKLLGIGTTSVPSYVNHHNPAHVIKGKVMYLKHYDQFYMKRWTRYKKIKKLEKSS